MNKVKKGLRVFFICVFALAFVLPILIGGLLFGYTQNVAKDMESCEATVTSVKQETDSSDTTTYKIEAEYKLDGKDGKLSTTLKDNSLKEGQTITVYYDIDTPEDLIYVDMAETFSLLKSLAACSGISLIVLVFLVLRAKNKGKEVGGVEDVLTEQCKD